MMRRLFRWLGHVLLLVSKALLVALLAAGLAWLAIKGWGLWQGHKRGELVEVQLVSSAEHVKEAELQQLLKPQLGLGFWQLDLPVIRDLVQSHPWVAQAEVSRFWPNTLRVEVVEQLPVARWGDDALLNQTGEVFRVGEVGQFEQLIQLSAVNPQPREVLMFLRTLLDAINPYGLHVRALHRMADSSWHVVLVDGNEWVLPAAQPMQALTRLLTLYGSIPLQEGRMRVDLRYRDGFAVKWFPVETPTPPVEAGPQP